MRQSLATFEEAFHEEAVEARVRSAELRREAVLRSRARRQDQQERQGTLRFIGLVTAILLTALIVTVVMFQTLALLFSP